MEIILLEGTEVAGAWRKCQTIQYLGYCWESCFIQPSANL